MKKLFLLIILLFFSLNIFAQSSNKNPDAIVGTWQTGSGKAKVQIVKEGDKYNGKIVWLKTPLNEEGKPKMDKNNPDAAKKTSPILGLNMLKGFKYDKANLWSNGTIYDPENGKTYSCKMTLREEKLLDVRGFVGVSMLGRTDTWYKVADVK